MVSIQLFYCPKESWSYWRSVLISNNPKEFGEIAETSWNIIIIIRLKIIMIIKPGGVGKNMSTGQMNPSISRQVLK